MKLIIDYALCFVGLPYLWGGDDPIKGFDCSGYVQEILKFAGIDPLGDQTAQGLFDYFKTKGIMHKRGPGALAFYGSSTDKITHVAFCVDELRCLHAGGGGSKTISLDIAAAQNAYIKGTPIEYRPDLVAVVMPEYDIK